MRDARTAPGEYTRGYLLALAHITELIDWLGQFDCDDDHEEQIRRFCTEVARQLKERQAA